MIGKWRGRDWSQGVGGRRRKKREENNNGASWGDGGIFAEKEMFVCARVRSVCP